MVSESGGGEWEGESGGGGGHVQTHCRFLWTSASVSLFSQRPVHFLSINQNINEQKTKEMPFWPF